MGSPQTMCLNFNAEQMAELFGGRSDAYFIDGRCVRPGGSVAHLIREHIHGTINMGIYPISEQGVCRWLCYDFDTPDADELAWDCHDRLKSIGITSWVEHSRSDTGRHVWIFTEETTGETAYFAARGLAYDLGFDCPEMNPKATGEDGQIVNCVRLPWYGWSIRRKGGQRFPGLDLEPWLATALALKTDKDTLVEFAAIGRVIERRKSEDLQLHLDSKGAESDSYWHAVINGEIKIPEGERDIKIWTLARKFVEWGYTKPLADESMERAYYNGLESPETYSLSLAREKVRRVYRGLDI